MRRRALAAGILAAAALGAGAAAASAAPATGTPGTLTVGLNLPSDGFQVGAVQGRTVVAARGFEIDLTQALQAKLGLSSLAMLQEPVFTKLLAPGPKPWDMAVAQATITPARAANVDFSVPYLTADQGVLLSLQTTARPASLAELKGLKLCAQKGSTGADLIAQRIRPTAAPTLPNSVTVLIRGLRSGACQAVVFDAPGLATLRAAVPGRYGPMAGIIPTGERYGVVFPKGSKLRGPVNRAIAALKKDGTMATIQKKWLSQDLTKLPVLR